MSVYDEIVAPHGRDLLPAWAVRARGPGGVVSDAEGRVLVNYLQQDLDRPTDPGAVPAGVGDITERPKA